MPDAPSQPPAAPPPAPKRTLNTLLWRILILPSLLILLITIGLYELLPMRDAFLNGEASGSYLLYGTYGALSPKFWMIGLSSVLFGVWLIVALVRTVGRGEWRYWQRIIGLLALTASAAVLLVIGLPQFGTDARDAGWTSLNDHFYHLLVQQIPSVSGTDLRFLIFDCDAQAIHCQRVQTADKQYPPGDRVPPLVVMQINVDGQVIVARGNSVQPFTVYRPQ